jgi:hypothetical protein
MVFDPKIGMLQINDKNITKTNQLDDWNIFVSKKKSNFKLQAG